LLEEASVGAVNAIVKPNATMITTTLFIGCLVT